MHKHICNFNLECFRWSWGPSHEVGSRQKNLAFFGCSFMCDPTQRGLSNINMQCTNCLQQTLLYEHRYITLNTDVLPQTQMYNLSHRYITLFLCLCKSLCSFPFKMLYKNVFSWLEVVNWEYFLCA